MAHRDFSFRVSMVAGEVQHLFLRTVVSLLLVYLVEGQNACVELHILITHLHRGESGRGEGSGTGAWVELPRGSFPMSRGSGDRHKELSPDLWRGPETSARGE